MAVRFEGGPARVSGVLHCFEKRTAQIERKDIEVAKERLKKLNEQQRTKKNTKLVAHRTKGSALDELNISKQDRLELKLKADLHQDILKLIKKKKFTPRQLEKLFDIPQPRVSELLRGKLSLLSVSKLLYYANLLGARADVKLKPAGRISWQTRKQIA